MATDYPTNLDDLTNPEATDAVTSPSHAGQHANANDAIEALQTKVGADSSAVNTTHDYKLSNVSTGDKAVSVTGTETLTNKTLTSPTLNTPTINVAGIKDTNGNETIDTPATASAVNQVEVKNSATGNDVEVNATGDDTNVNISVKGKGTGVVKIGSGDIEMPNTIGGSGQVLTSDGASSASWTDKADITGVAEIKASAYILAQAQSTPDLTLQVSEGNVYFGSTLVEYAGGNSPSFTAPTTNPRIDVLSLNSSGTLIRTAGDEGATPTAPDVPIGNVAIAQIYNRVGQTSIKDADDSTNGYIQKDLRSYLGFRRGGWKLVDSWTYSTNVTEVDFTDLPALDSFLIVLEGVTTGDSWVYAYVSEDNGSTFLTTGKYGYGASLQDFLRLGTVFTASWVQFDLCTTSSYKTAKMTYGYTDRQTAGIVSTSAVNAFRITPNSTGNLTAGAIKVYGWY